VRRLGARPRGEHARRDIEITRRTIAFAWMRHRTVPTWLKAVRCPCGPGSIGAAVGADTHRRALENGRLCPVGGTTSSMGADRRAPPVADIAGPTCEEADDGAEARRSRDGAVCPAPPRDLDAPLCYVVGATRRSVLQADSPESPSSFPITWSRITNIARSVV